MNTARVVLESLTRQLSRRESLSPEQIMMAISSLVAENIAPAVKADFLSALAVKGETVEEITVFAEELRKLSIQPELDPATRAGEILDVCGTGGDRLNTFNISTSVALVAASAGVTVAKHGNRAVTSQTGSADVLEALGIRIDLSPAEAAQALREHHFAFFFAPKYHPAFKHIGPARKLCSERGQRTIFNFLGPLLNPARPSAQLIGVPRPEICEPIARVLQGLGVRRGMVVSGCVVANERAQVSTNNCFLDEFSTLGVTHIAEFYHERGFHKSDFAPDQLPMQRASIADLAGGDRQMNADILRSILSGKERGPKRDAVVLNSAAALLVAGKVPSLSHGWELATELIDAGHAMAKLEALTRASR